jgi:hypothetical protein
MEELEIRVGVEDNDDLSAAEDAAAAIGVEITFVQAPPGPDIEPQIAPIVAVAIGAGALAGAKFIVDWWERRKGGLIIDLRPTALDTFRRDRNVPWGYVITFPVQGGEVKVETKDAPKDAVERWISEVIAGAFKSAADVANAAAKVFGKGHVEPPPE